MSCADDASVGALDQRLQARGGAAVLLFLLHQRQLQGLVLFLGLCQFLAEGGVLLGELGVLLQQVVDQLLDLIQEASSMGLSQVVAGAHTIKKSAARRH